jgi:hypothetical protein
MKNLPARLLSSAVHSSLFESAASAFGRYALGSTIKRTHDKASFAKPPPVAVRNL